jgi:hydroxymethylglutaryl-CoA lyase
MSALEIVEVGPRDGLQNEDAVLDVAARVAYIEALAAAGLRRIEAVSFVHPARVPQMAGAEAVMAAVPRPDGVRYSGLVLNRRGMERAVAAGVDEINMVVVATDTFSAKNQGMTTAEAVRATAGIAAAARDAGLRVTLTVGAAFGCPFEGEVRPERVTDIVRQCAEAGVNEVALADTIGVAVPRDVRTLASAVRSVTDAPLRCHFHNTRNTGYANALAAIEAGVTALDASSGGIGGCPFAPAATGNIATEDLLYALGRSGIGTGVDMTALLAASAYVEQRLGHANPALLGRAGMFPALRSSLVSGGGVVPRSGSADRVYDTLRQGILDGTYAQGARLGEADLADSLGVSRTPVREALRRLGSEGLLATLPNKGARVRTWTAGELGDIFDLRALLEGHAAARAATRVTDADISAMNDLVTRMEAAAGEGVSPDIDLITELNGAFHGAIVAASGNSLLPELMNSLIHVPVVSHTYRLYSPARMRQSMRQHRELLDAVTAGDPAWAEAVMRVHVLSARPVLVGAARDTAHDTERPGEEP